MLYIAGAGQAAFAYVREAAQDLCSLIERPADEIRIGSLAEDIMIRLMSVVSETTHRWERDEEEWVLQTESRAMSNAASSNNLVSNFIHCRRADSFIC